MSYGTLVQAGDYIEKSVFEFPLNNVGAPHGKRTKYDFKFRTVDNARIVKKHFIRLVRHRLTEAYGKPLLITLTFSDHITDATVGYAFFRLAMQRFRNAFGHEFAYIAVPEWQQSGRLHFHILAWGVPLSVTLLTLLITEARKRCPESKLRTVFDDLWKNGFTDVKATDGNPALASYLGKYLTKSLFDPRYSCIKAFTRSRNFGTYTKIYTEILDTVCIGVDINSYKVLYEVSYDARFIGKCNYQLRINHHDECTCRACRSSRKLYQPRGNQVRRQEEW